MQPRGLSEDLCGWARGLLTRRWFWLAMPLWLYLVAFVTTNTWWFKQAITTKLLPIAGLRGNYDVLWWFPGLPIVIDGWTVAQIEPLREQDPLPLLRVQRVIVDLNWRQVRHPLVAVRSITMQRPQLRLSAELLAGLVQMMSQRLRVEPVTSDANLAANSTATTPSTLPSGDHTPREQVAQQTMQATPHAPAVNERRDQAANTVPSKASDPSQPVMEMMGPPHLISPSVPAKPIDPRLPLRLMVQNGALECYSIRARERVMRVEGVEADLPVQGADAAGFIRVGSINCNGVSTRSGAEIPLRWHYPVLETSVVSWEWQRLKGELQFQLARQPGLPFTMTVVTRQDHVSRDAHAWGAADLAGGFQCIGYALSPLSVQAQLRLGAKNIEIAYKEQVAHFDRLAVTAQMQNGVLQCADFRLIGDSFSLLGNGIAAVDGRHAAVARLVMPPQAQSYVSSTWNAYFPTLPLNLKPFVTEDRIVGEIEVSGSVPQTLITANQGKAIGDARAMIWNLWQRNMQKP